MIKNAQAGSTRLLVAPHQAAASQQSGRGDHCNGRPAVVVQHPAPVRSGGASPWGGWVSRRATMTYDTVPVAQNATASLIAAVMVLPTCFSGWVAGNRGVPGHPLAPPTSPGAHRGRWTRIKSTTRQPE